MSATAFEMHMARTGGLEVLRGREVELPAPGPGEARVAIEAAGVAFADIVMRTGLYPGVKAPVTPGYDFVGRIEALGPGVEGVQVGQRVAALTVTGSYATRRNVEARFLVAAPEDAPAEALVAGVLNGLTAWQMFHRCQSTQASRVERSQRKFFSFSSSSICLFRTANLNSSCSLCGMSLSFLMPRSRQMTLAISGIPGKLRRGASASTRVVLPTPLAPTTMILVSLLLMAASIQLACCCLSGFVFVFVHSAVILSGRQLHGSLWDAGVVSRIGIASGVAFFCRSADFVFQRFGQIYPR